MVSMLMYAMGYFGLRQPEIFTGNYSEVNVEPAKKKYEKSSLSEEDSLELGQRLNEMMRSEKLYMKSNLSLPDLAKHLGVSTHHVSQVINGRGGTTFYEYVNSRRVEEAKRLLKDPAMDHLSIAGIGFEAGFNSLSAFNAVFKKYAGEAPSAYRNREK